MQTLMEKEIFEIPQVIKNCIDYNEAAVKKIKDYLSNNKIRFILVAARGTSDHAGLFFKYLIESQCGLPVVLAAPSVSTMYNSRYQTKESMVIGLSQSGMAEDVIEIVEDAKKNGAFTIGITNDCDSRLAVCAETHLYCNCGPEKSVAATKTFIAQMVLLTLLSGLINIDADDQDIRDKLMIVSDEIKRILSRKIEIYSKAELLKNMTECFTLARGYNYAIALESALKMQECAYVKAKSYSTADFMHGPIAMIDEGSTCFVYANEDIFSDELLDLAKRIKQYGAKLVAISDDDRINHISDIVIKLEKPIAQVMAPFYTAVVIQLFACGLSIAKGLNPDIPRNLKKVTITK